MTQFQHGFTLWKKKGVRFFTVPSFERAGGVLCAVSTRVGGVSPAPFDSLNFSRARENNEDNYQKNMRRFSSAVGFDMQNAVANHYEHGISLYHVLWQDAGSGVTKENLAQHCDGLYTTETGLPLITYHADCVPLMFYDPRRRAAAICHAGWRGVMNHIIPKAVRALIQAGSEPSDILTAVGPCISVKYFEVQEDVYVPFQKTFGKEVIACREGNVYVDLPKACALDMLACGIEAGNITLSDLCTFDNKRLFYSHRRDEGKTGAMAAVIVLKE